MLVTPIHLVFVAAGLAIVVWALRRRWTLPPAAPAPAGSPGEIVGSRAAPRSWWPGVLTVRSAR